MALSEGERSDYQLSLVMKYLSRSNTNRYVETFQRQRPHILIEYKNVVKSDKYNINAHMIQELLHFQDLFLFLTNNKFYHKSALFNLTGQKSSSLIDNYNLEGYQNAPESLLWIAIFHGFMERFRE